MTVVTRIVNDIIIWGSGATIDEALANHDHHLKQLLNSMEEQNVRLNAEKLKFRFQEAKFASYILSSKGHRADSEKVRCIRGMAPPENVTELRRFYGMVNYLAKYMPNHATAMEPLHQLTHNGVSAGVETGLSKK